MTSAAGREQLHLKLPDSWLVVDPLTLSDADLPGPVRAALSTSTRAHNFPLPDLLASVFTAVVDGDGTFQEAVIASLVVVTVPAVEIDAVRVSIDAVEIVRDVPVSEGSEADFLTLILPVTSKVTALTTLLCFASPNLSRAGEVEAGFRSIASTARLLELPQDT